ncbi:MAG: hypothetical protein ABSD13_20050 [Candidatus Korobacteraceae bacterium]|jgi:hypothetical protein
MSWLWLLLVVVFGASMLSGQTGGAMLYSNGDVKVNGQSAGISTSIFSGDRVDVTGSSAGSINRSGSSIVVSPNSSIQYAAASVEVLQGTARVSTNKGMSASVGQIVVSPKDAAAKFDVVKADNKVVVVSRDGALTVKNGSSTTIVQSGASIELPLGLATGQALSGDQGSNAALASFLPKDHLLEHPFYGVLKGVDITPATLPVCADFTECVRPNVSQIRPCCCPPRVLCQ